MPIDPRHWLTQQGGGFYPQASAGARFNRAINDMIYGNTSPEALAPTPPHPRLVSEGGTDLWNPNRPDIGGRPVYPPPIPPTDPTTSMNIMYGQYNPRPFNYSPLYPDPSSWNNPPFYEIPPPADTRPLVGDWERPAMPAFSPDLPIQRIPPPPAGMGPQQIPNTLGVQPEPQTIGYRSTPTPPPYNLPALQAPMGNLTSGATVNLADMPPDYQMQGPYSAYDPTYDYGGGGGDQFSQLLYQYLNDPSGFLASRGPIPAINNAMPLPTSEPMAAPANPLVNYDIGDYGGGGGGGEGGTPSERLDAIIAAHAGEPGHYDPYQGWVPDAASDIPTAPGATPDVAPATPASTIEQATQAGTDIDISGVPGMYGLNTPGRRTFLGDLGLDIRDIARAIGGVPGLIGKGLRAAGGAFAPGGAFGQGLPSDLGFAGARGPGVFGGLPPGYTEANRFGGGAPIFTPAGFQGPNWTPGGSIYGGTAYSGNPNPMGYTTDQYGNPIINRGSVQAPGAFGGTMGAGIGPAGGGALGTLWDRLQMRNFWAGGDPTMGFGNVNPITEFAAAQRGPAMYAPSWAEIGQYFPSRAAAPAAPVSPGDARAAQRGIGGPGGRGMAVP